MFLRGPSTYPSTKIIPKLVGKQNLMKAEERGTIEEKKQIDSKRKILGLRFKEMIALFHRINLNNVRSFAT
jgi:hypothetical protein